MQYDIKDISLAPAGKLKIEWASDQMKVQQLIRARFKREKPLKGVSVAACLHVTSETANLMITLKEGGADIFICASNPLSTQDEVAASLVKDYGIATFAIKGEDNATYYRHLEAALENKPQITMDDGADLVSLIHSKKKHLLKYIIGGTEETTTGVIRLKAMELDHVLKYPIVAVNDANTKHMFDNRYGTGQSTIDGIIRATNFLLAGSNFVVMGYGWCGRGAAMRAKGMGANVYVTEIDPLKAIEANMDGFMVVDSETASKIGDVFVTLTGNVDVLTDRHFKLMKDGAIICNSGHFNVEINLPVLKKMSKNVRQMREFVEEYTLKNGKKICVLGDGRLINLAAAEGHPASVMDMSFANQALCAEFMKKNAKKLKDKVYSVPKNIDENIAALKLKSMGITIDALSKRQKEYLASWQEGT